MVAGYSREYESLITALTEIFPFIDRPIVPPQEGGNNTIDVSFREKGLPNPIRIDRASSGQVEALTILLRLMNAPEGSFVTIEEPESHFHADALRRVQDFIRKKATGGTQILVASHSAVILSDVHLPADLPVYFFSREDSGPTKVEIVLREQGAALVEAALDNP
jgi:predicted ATPase